LIVGDGFVVFQGVRISDSGYSEGHVFAQLSKNTFDDSSPKL